MDTLAKYHDGKYHVEEYPSLSGKVFTIVNVYGEPCYREGNIIICPDLNVISPLVEKLNECPDGGLITNLE